MEFRTEVTIKPMAPSISHSSKIMLLGSCFSENIGTKLQESKFSVDINPFGILYNPLSINKALSLLIENRSFPESELFYHNGMFHSFMHHGSFSNINKTECLKKISNRFEKARKLLPHIDFLIITFGTAYIYTLTETGTVVNNCHKLPASTFERSRLTVYDILKCWKHSIGILKEQNPNITIIFTVSPIRHLKDGVYENQLSKATLLLSIDALRNIYPETVRYFPAYEIMMDELRDYRFYAEDMIHPSSVAINYIWKRFAESYFSKNTNQVNSEWQSLQKAMSHRVIHQESGEYHTFLERTYNKVVAFAKRYPYINVDEEMKALKTNLNNQ